MVGSSASAAATIRRQQFLIRCLLGGYSESSIWNKSYHSIRMHSAMSGGSTIEADAISILRSITPSLDPSRHKGQAGKPFGSPLYV